MTATPSGPAPHAQDGQSTAGVAWPFVVPDGLSIRLAPAPASDGAAATAHDGQAQRPRLIVGGLAGGEIDISNRIVAAIAHALWEARGREAIANWADAERLYDQLFTTAPTDANGAARPGARQRGGFPDGSPVARSTRSRSTPPRSVPEPEARGPLPNPPRVMMRSPRPQNRQS